MAASLVVFGSGNSSRKPAKFILYFDESIQGVWLWAHRAVPGRSGRVGDPAYSSKPTWFR